jgi:hypothetical protein
VYRISGKISLSQNFCGEGGIRTHGTLAGTPVFKTGAINHSATSPKIFAENFPSIFYFLISIFQCENLEIGK